MARRIIILSNAKDQLIFQSNVFPEKLASSMTITAACLDNPELLTWKRLFAKRPSFQVQIYKAKSLHESGVAISSYKLFKGSFLKFNR